MDALEEQLQELEALEAIFETDYALEAEAEAGTGARFRITVDGGESRVTLHFVHPPDYPDAPVSVTVRAEEGVGSARRSALQRELGRAAVEVVAAKAVGTPVTAESFARWRASFDAERDAARRHAELAAPTAKPTGREMFEARAADVVAPASESFWEAAADEYDD